MSDLERSMDIWKREMTGVDTYYAVKCNPNPMMIQKLAGLGANFDCASPAEIDLVIAQGVCASRILYANPCKRVCDIEYAAARGVTMTTFDSICELEKIARVAPDMQVMLRIYANDPSAKCVLSNKFGAHEYDWEALVSKAHELGLKLCGISFHVGSGASSPSAFTSAIAKTRQVYDLAKKYGYNANIIDLGGGFSRMTIYEIAPAIQDALDKYFAYPFEGIVIAEPGRFFAETTATIYTRVIGVKYDNDGHQYATITDGLYGSFNNVVYDHAVLIPECLHETDAKLETTIFGPTCDGFDTVATCVMPKLQCGDYVFFRNMGAYTIAGSCDFNGIKFTAPSCYYI